MLRLALRLVTSTSIVDVPRSEYPEFLAYTHLGYKAYAKFIGQQLTAEQPDKNAAGKPPSAYVIFSMRRC
jgi:hypothetical protein